MTVTHGTRPREGKKLFRKPSYTDGRQRTPETTGSNVKDGQQQLAHRGSPSVRRNRAFRAFAVCDGGAAAPRVLPVLPPTFNYDVKKKKITHDRLAAHSRVKLSHSLAVTPGIHILFSKQTRPDYRGLP